VTVHLRGRRPLTRSTPPASWPRGQCTLGTTADTRGRSVGAWGYGDVGPSATYCANHTFETYPEDGCEDCWAADREAAYGRIERWAKQQAPQSSSLRTRVGRRLHRAGPAAVLTVAGLEPRNVNRAFARLLTRAKLRHVRLHDLRHSFGVLLLENGEHIRVVMELLGHSQLSETLKRYTKVRDQLQRDAIDRLDVLLRGEDAPVTLSSE